MCDPFLYIYFPYCQVCLSNAVERVQKSMAIKDDWEAELTKMSVSTEERMAPRHALRELERAMPKVSYFQ